MKTNSHLTAGWLPDSISISSVLYHWPSTSYCLASGGGQGGFSHFFNESLEGRRRTEQKAENRLHPVIISSRRRDKQSPISPKLSPSFSLSICSIQMGTTFASVIIQKRMKQDPSFSQFADAPDLQAYQSKPVETYGLSLLQSMGFTPERGIGHNRKNALTEPLILKPRPRGLGLGAEQQGQEKKPKFEVGAEVVITKGPHDGLSGVVVEIREQELMVELKKSGSLVRVNAEDVRAVTKQKKQELQGEEGERKKKRLKWVVPNIRVKVVDKKSKYYLKKVIVSEVLSDKEFECLYREDGQQLFLRSLREKDLQTVVPKLGGEVLIVRGSHLGERGKVLKTDKQAEKVVVQTEAELELITVNQDDVSEYVDL